MSIEEMRMMMTGSVFHTDFDTYLVTHSDAQTINFMCMRPSWVRPVYFMESWPSFIRYAGIITVIKV